MSDTYRHSETQLSLLAFGSSDGAEVARTVSQHRSHLNARQYDCTTVLLYNVRWATNSMPLERHSVGRPFHCFHVDTTSIIIYDILYPFSGATSRVSSFILCKTGNILRIVRYNKVAVSFFVRRCMVFLGSASFCFEGVEGESILLNLDLLGITASSGSACTSGSVEPSHVLIAMGLSPEWSHGSLRLTLGKASTEDDVERVIAVLPNIIKKLRSLGV